MKEIKVTLDGVPPTEGFTCQDDEVENIIKKMYKTFETTDFVIEVRDVQAS